MMQENQTQSPVDDVSLSVVQSYGDSIHVNPKVVGWHKEIPVGTCRANLTIGLPENFPVGNHKRVRFDVVILTRLQTFRETIDLFRENDKEYLANITFNGPSVSYQQSVRLAIINNSHFESPPKPVAGKASDARCRDLKNSVECPDVELINRTLQMANGIEDLYQRFQRRCPARS
jgi:hypothetical protein